LCQVTCNLGNFSGLVVGGVYGFLLMNRYSLSVLAILIMLGVVLFVCYTMEDTESLLVPRVTVEGDTLVSKGFPEGTVAVDDVLSYVGGETFILYDAARCEVHLFAEADEGGRVLRLYWFQFEGYLPSAVPRGYDYSGDPCRTIIGMHEFYDSVRYFNVADSRGGWPDDSDTMHVFRLLEREGYRLDGDVMRVRLVRLDQDNQQELMIVYMEDLGQHGLSLTGFEGAGGGLKWKEACKGLRARALAGMKMDMK
jgi:hypothetical protein